MKEPIIKEYEVETSVENWTEVSITHKLISKKYLKWLMPKFEQVPFASKVYYANNGVFRICMIGNEKGVIPALNRGIPDDICILPHKGYCTIMRNEKQDYYEREQQVIKIICGSLDEWKIIKKLGKLRKNKILDKFDNLIKLGDTIEITFVSGRKQYEVVKEFNGILVVEDNSILDNFRKESLRKLSEEELKRRKK